jgi:hypothetical protein
MAPEWAQYIDGEFRTLSTCPEIIEAIASQLYPENSEAARIVVDLRESNSPAYVDFLQLWNEPMPHQYANIERMVFELAGPDVQVIRWGIDELER